HADKKIIMDPIAEFEAMIDERTEATVASLRTRTTVLTTLIVALAAVTVLLTWLSISRHGRRLRRSIEELTATAENVGSGATQVSAASQSLAQGATEQVTALEDIAASARETSSMATDNARRTQEASELVEQEQHQFGEAASRLGEMVTAMQEIDAAGVRISTINKVIDEIAFQTNILALNAAVEAARAGEAGAGFAVVADEVRLLAQRSAAAAKETADRIEAAIESSRQGAASCSRVGGSLNEIADRIKAADQLVAEIATAAREQSQGIRQISTAMTQLDQVTQENATRADEGARAAADLSDQAEAVESIVENLRSLIPRARHAAPPRAAAPRQTPAPQPRQLPSAPRIPMPGDKHAAAVTPDAEDRHFTDF
ncbi:MAG: methyl-accepting chemotaxis protein, partial [Planctomycetota bacterium]|nr:methyl-accepting chemotaxis protein [Planctomycetota bacterium]